MTEQGVQLLEDEQLQWLDDAYKIYEKQMLKIPLPTSSFDELKQKHIEYENQAKDYLRNKVNDEQLIDDLHHMCKQAIKEISYQNEVEAQNICNQFINREFKSLKSRLGEYKSILEYERDIKIFYQFLLEHGPKTVLKQQVYQEFYNNMMNQGADMFIKKSQVLESKNAQKVNFESALQEKERVIQDMMEKIREQDKQKQNHINQIKLLEEQLFQNEKQSEIIQMELQKQKETHLQQIKQYERTLYLKESEFIKQKALSEQKISHLNKMIEQSQKKENQMDNSFISTKSEYTHQIRDVQQKYEALLSQLQDKLVTANDKVAQLQDHVLSLESLNAQLTLKLQQKETRMLDYENQLQKMQNSYINVQNNNENIFADDFEKENKILKEQNEILEAQIKDKADKFIKLKTGLEKDYALVRQENQFLKIQLDELKQQLITQKKNFEQTISLLDNQSIDMTKSNTFSKQYVELKETHINEIKQLEYDFDIQRKKLNQQLDQLAQENRILEGELITQQNEFNREITLLKNRVNQQEDQLTKLNKDYYLLEQSKTRQQKELEERYLNKCKQLELEIESIKAKSMKDFEQMQQKNEEQIQQLRSLYENERLKLEQKFIQDRKNMDDKYNRMIEEVIEEYKQNNSNSELQIMQKKLKQGELYFNQMQQHWQSENEMKQKQIQSLEGINTELKLQLAKVSANSNSNQQQELESLHNKIQELQQQIQDRNNQIYQYEDQVLKYEQGKQESIINLKQQLNNERKQMHEQIDKLKQEIDNLHDENLKSKVEYEKQIALDQQESEFQQHKIKELQQLIEQLSSKQVEPIQLKFESNFQNINLENELKEQQNKYDKLRQQYKEQEIQNNRIILQLKEDIEQLKVNQQQQQQQQLTQQQQQQQQESNINEIQNLKKKIAELELENSEIKADHDRDVLLYQEKFKFLEEQKKQAKNDFQEAMKKFEYTINHIQKARQQDLEEESNSISEMLATLEKKFQLQVMDLSDSHAQQIQEYESKISQLERTLQQYLDSSSFNQVLEQQEQKHEYEMEQLKLEFETKMEELYFNMAEERQNWRQKLQDVEDRYKDSELRRSNMVFEHEKERAKWNLEKDELSYQRLELQEENSKLELKKEELVKEVEKTKSDKKKKIGIIRGRLSPNKSPGTFSNVSKLGMSFDTFQQPSIELEEQTKSINFVPGESFEAYYMAKNQNE